MNRMLILGLALVGGLSLYLSAQSDDDLLAPGKQGSAQHGQRASRVAAARKPAADARTKPIEPWVQETLTQGVAQWQARLHAREEVLASASDQQAWAGLRPPEPARAPVVATLAPPAPLPPMAPRFPHAWVGRFNDEPPLAAASGASDAADHGVARAVLTGPESTWVVRAGDVIEGQWRVDRIQGRTMSLTYLPLKQQQTVVMR